MAKCIIGAIGQRLGFFFRKTTARRAEMEKRDEASFFTPSGTTVSNTVPVLLLRVYGTEW